MKKRTLLSILICFAFNLAFSQSGTYEKGYFIDNSNKRVECLIKNLEWETSPTEFEYKTDENSETKTISLNDFHEFGVGEEYKFIKADVKIDKSSDKRESASTVKAFNFVDETLLLRVRVEGGATLYSYNNGRYLRFFYKKDSNVITPLSYKIYFNGQEYEVAKNETYKQELLNALKCESITQTNINKLEYTPSSLSDFFIKYNTCSGTLTNKFDGEKKIKTFQIYAKAGIGISDFSFNNYTYDATYSKKANLKVGFDAEINMSNIEKKWSAIVGLTYQHYSNSYSFDYNTPFTADIDYSVIDVSAEMRRYFALNETSHLFMDAGFVFGIGLTSDLNFSEGIQGYSGANAITLDLGLGYLYNNKYSVEVNYEFGRNIFENHNTLNSKFKTISVMLGYKFL